ncbi:hypothetical protein EYF80_006643 [Liparis tanakae]|uniref:Uncharacterized protein n=1 Tax=Liparis tanakae TaxID=230148 RepID=A0A4Z2IYS4_9TELE|nr:hypothetical protein EYF80_006643 [Liparis tanakae]
MYHALKGLYGVTHGIAVFSSITAWSLGTRAALEKRGATSTLLKEPDSMDTPFMPANVRSVMLKASSILKPGRECCSFSALFLTSSWERPSVTTTSTFGTFLRMPLSEVNTFS